MAATFVGITQEEIEQFLTRAYRALRPHKDVIRGEIVYDLNLSRNTVIRVWSSVSPRGEGAGIGEDAIRIQLFSKTTSRPLKKGKSPIVKRTTNWRDNLKARIGDAAEEYEDREAYWEAQAAGKQDQRPAPSNPAPTSSPSVEDRKPTIELDWDEARREDESSGARLRIKPDSRARPPTDKQLSYLSVLLKRFGGAWWGFAQVLPGKAEIFSNLETPPTVDELKAAGGWACSDLIGFLVTRPRYARDTQECPDPDPSNGDEILEIFHPTDYH